MNQQIILSLKNINKSFSGVQVLNDVSIDFYAGEIHCLLGENGAGKSTLIKIISGAYTFDKGEIIYNGKTLINNNPQYGRKNGINTIYQEVDIVPSLSASENIYLGNEIVTKFGNLDRKTINKKAKELLVQMGVDIDVTIPVSKLKLAQQQMVVIAKALSLNSKIIIFDEPTAVFTKKEIKILFDLINKLRNEGLAIIYISHHLDEIFEIGDKITVLRDGNLIKTGSIDDFDKTSLINQMVGRHIDLSQRTYYEDFGTEILRLENISKRGVAKDINFTLREGEILGIAGLVGSGRSEMARLIVGLEKYDSGNIYYKGSKMVIKSPLDALQKGISILPEDRKGEGIVSVRSIGENVSYSLIPKRFKLLVKWKQIRSVRQNIINKVSIRPGREKLQVEFLSGGNQQKVVLGKLLAANSDLLILDEPTRGVDIGAREEIYKLMQDFRKQKKAILMISSDITEILSQSDRILVMANGMIVGQLNAKEATQEKIFSYAFQIGGNKHEE